MLYNVDVVQQAVIVSCLLTGITENTTCSCHKHKRKVTFEDTMYTNKSGIPIHHELGEVAIAVQEGKNCHDYTQDHQS